MKGAFLIKEQRIEIELDGGREGGRSVWTHQGWFDQWPDVSMLCLSPGQRGTLHESLLLRLTKVNNNCIVTDSMLWLL